MEQYVPMKVLHDFVERIESLGVEYMLTGSMAMIRYTVFRQTADIDIVLELSYQDKDKFIKALETGYYIPTGSLSRAIETKNMFNVIHFETAFKVDCILKKLTEFQKTSFERRERTDYYGKEIWIIGKEDLILSKLLWAKDSLSEIQFRDIKNLMRSGFDENYTEQWIEKLRISDSYYSCRKELES
jgi:hypothetical protein